MKHKQKPIKLPADAVKNRRMHEIYNSPGEGEKGLSPSEMYGRNQMIRVKCAMCGKVMLVKAATYPHWMRRRDKTIAWLCDACDWSPMATVHLGETKGR